MCDSAISVRRHVQFIPRVAAPTAVEVTDALARLDDSLSAHQSHDVTAWTLDSERHDSVAILWPSFGEGKPNRIRQVEKFSQPATRANRSFGTRERSRVESTALLGRALQDGITPPRVWVQMSTAHIYGDPPEVVCDEDSALATGWLRRSDKRGRGVPELAFFGRYRVSRRLLDEGFQFQFSGSRARTCRSTESSFDFNSGNVNSCFNSDKMRRLNWLVRPNSYSLSSNRFFS